MKLILTIEASEWTEDNANTFIDWLNDELSIGNMGTGDDAIVTDSQIIE